VVPLPKQMVGAELPGHVNGPMQLAALLPTDTAYAVHAEMAAASE
jgi:hypothetical protein